MGVKLHFAFNKHDTLVKEIAQWFYLSYPGGRTLISRSFFAIQAFFVVNNITIGV